MLAELESESPEIRAKGSAEILARHRPEDIAEIRRIAEKYLPNATRQGTVRDSILLLGKLRAVVEIPFLVRNLTFQAFYKNTKRPQPPEDLYPAVQALIDIGKPSVQPVLSRLASEDGDQLEANGALVLHHILGRDGAQAMLSAEIAVKRDQRVQARLRRVAAAVGRLP